jgi:hypothetical protein
MKNRPIENGWISFCERVIRPNVAPEDTPHFRLCFFAGVLYLAHLLQDYEADSDVMKAVEAELNEFQQRHSAPLM